MKKLHVFDAKLRALFEKNIILDVKHHYEGVAEAKKSMKYMFSAQNCAFSSKKNIILDVKPHYEGVSEPKKSMKYMFSTQNCAFSSKKTLFWM